MLSAVRQDKSISIPTTSVVLPGAILSPARTWAAFGWSIALAKSISQSLVSALRSVFTSHCQGCVESETWRWARLFQVHGRPSEPECGKALEP